ncbi:MAG: hypothetical protein V4501_11900 [Pseudomonadota bacterium]
MGDLPNTSSSTATMMQRLNLPTPQVSQTLQQTPIDEKSENKSISDNRPRTRSITQRNPLENDEIPKTTKQFMYLLANGEDEMEQAADTWRIQQANRRQVIMDSKSNILRHIPGDGILYIHCHTFVDGENHKPRGTIGGLTKSGDDIEFNSQQLAAHLELKGLSKEHKKLKLFCCYSDSMVDSLFKALNDRGFKQIELVGYKGEVTLLGHDFHKAAGLSVQQAKIITGEYIDDTGKRISPKGVITEDHIAKRHQVIMNKIEYANKHPEEFTESQPLKPSSLRMR